MELLRKTVRPESLNRVDELIMFRPLSKVVVWAVVHLQLDQLMSKLEENDIHLMSSDELIENIVESGYDPQFGARPIKRMIQKELLNALSTQIIAGTIETGTPLVVDVFDGKIVFRAPIAKERTGNPKKGKDAVNTH